MGATFLNFAFLVLAATIFFGVGLAALVRRGLSSAAGRSVLLFNLLGLAACVFFLWVMLQPQRFHPNWVFLFAPLACMLLLPAFLLLSHFALFSPRSLWVTVLLWVVWVAATILFTPGLFSFNQPWIEGLPASLRPILAGSFLFAGWFVIIVQIALDFRQAIYQPATMAVRKRAQMWFLTWMAVTLGSGLLVARQASWGLLAISIGSGAAAYITLSRNLPYPRFLAREALNYLLLLLPAAALAWAGFFLLRSLDQVLPLYGTLTIAAAFALLWVSTFRLLQRISPRWVERLIPATRYDLNHVLSEYSQSISNATAPNLMAEASIGLISNAIGLQFGHLFEVISEATQTKPNYLIQDAGGIGELNAVSFNISSLSPFSHYFRTASRPLTTDELHTIPLFRSASQAELDWFNNPRVEVFVPINTKDNWVGLFALGAKVSGAPYSDDDLTLVNTLADQLSLALQNARLVDSLMRVNNDYRRAYSSMEQTNRQLQQAFSQLERIDRTKTDFISVASHELRTPLTVMRGYNEMLLDDQAVKNNAYQLKMVKGIHSAMLRMTEIIDSMLDVATIDTRSLRLHKEAVAPNFIIRNVVDALCPAMDERKISVKVDNLRELPSIQADSDGLYKVFNHLITNAIKYTPDGGNIAISAQVLPPGQHGFAEGGIEVVIIDTGIGIAHENLTLIFQKFYQTGQLSLHSSGKTKFKGAGPGLGLAIAKGIVEAHGGLIWAESPGYDEENFPGSQFHVALPLKGPEEKSFPGAAEI